MAHAQLETSTQDIGVVKFNEVFRDPDQATTKELARIEGISAAEAKNRIELMNEASILIDKLRLRFPNQFAGALAVNKAPFHINVYFSDVDPVQMSAQMASMGASAKLQPVLKVGSAPISEKAARAKARGLLKQMSSRGISGTVAWSAIGDRYKLLVKNTAETATAGRMGFINIDKNVRVEAFSGIRTTGAGEVYGGQLYDGAPVNQRAGNCTIGFSVRKTGSNDYGVSTAGHCTNDGWYEFRQENPGNHVQLGFKQEWITNGADIQWHSFLGGNNFTIVPKFWNGTSLVNVTGGQGDYGGMFACKYGESTYRTCGYVDIYQYTSVDANTGHVFGDFPRINKEAAYSPMVNPGDSGGPVFLGTLAVGLVHGEDQYDNVYYMPLRALTANGIPLSVTCKC